jgi:type I restriction enzyme S subunit
MSLPRYPSYKDSGVEWLGEVPGHWETSRLRYICQCLDGQRIPLNASQRSDKLGDIPYWGANSIVDYVDEALFDEDLVLLGEDGAPFFEPSKPVAFFSQGKVWPNNHVHVLRPTVQGTGTFITHVLNVTDYAQFIDGSTRDKLTQGSMNDISIPWPPLPEQTQIAAFLDRETAKIDELVAEQRRLMELLKEKRQAVISHAVTQGLNPHAPMKPSGIEWLGEVQGHWEVKRLKHALRLLTEKTDRRDNPIALENIEGWSGRFISTGTEFQGEGVAFECGDILFGKLRPYLAKVYLTASSGEAVGDFHVMRPAQKIDGRFVVYQMLNRDFIAIVDSSTFGAKMPRVAWEFMSSMVLTIPPIEEQCAIAVFLDVETAKFDTLTTEANRAIALLQEHRSALISAAVTGKIDVRGVCA